MSRAFVVVLIAVVLSLGAGRPPPARAALAPEALACDAPDAPGDRREIACVLGTASASQRLRFKAHFSGSHDDTLASMRATLDGAALACEPGSKTELMGEDGDVSLHCDFTLPARAAAAPRLQVVLTWRHAQYTGYELDSAK